MAKASSQREGFIHCIVAHFQNCGVYFKNRRRIFQLVGMMVGIHCFGACVSAAEESTDDWSFEVSPYLWVANIKLETGATGSAPGPGVERFETRVAAGAMFAAQVRYRSVGLYVDSAWVRLKTEAIDPGPIITDLNLQSDFVHTTVALTYALAKEGKLHADVLAGARIWNVANEFVANTIFFPGVTADASKCWVDPLIGGSVSYDFAERWSVVAKGTVGGFGVSADFAGEAFAGVNYRISDCCSTTLGYRYLYEKYERGNMAFDLRANGFLLGFGFHF